MILEEDPFGEDVHSACTLAEEKKLEECGGEFKFKGYARHIGLESVACNERRPCPPRVSLYARMGLHRYNWLKGRKFELSRVGRYVKTIGSAASTYYMTLYAMDMGGGGGGGASLPPETCFEIAVSEYSANCFILFCDIARIQGEEDQTKRRRKRMDTHLPEWPPVNPLYMVEKSEVQEHDEWIRLYVELAVAFDFPPRGGGDFEILDVAMDRNDEGLDAKNATFYISYRDLDDARLGKSCHRIATVRRSFDEDSGNFYLVGGSEFRTEGSSYMHRPLSI
ncbi:unnamed protein product [Microthlaspi erraticum]|uniref:Uncharacterized protein n=1 Tax=Microthlaspi erraticum TaxID=1685480 RepID=A0A6D2LB73_9BRAS|nr:unnamed protein product [Microthlaspi erraticum]